MSAEVALRVSVQVRLSKELVRKVDHFAVDHDLTRTKAVELLLRDALKAKETLLEVLTNHYWNELGSCGCGLTCYQYEHWTTHIAAVCRERLVENE